MEEEKFFTPEPEEITANDIFDLAENLTLAAIHSVITPEQIQKLYRKMLILLLGL